MRIMTEDGDREVTWESANKIETGIAEREFTQLMDTGSFLAYMIDQANASPTLITSFHPESDTIVIVPILAGG